MEAALGRATSERIRLEGPAGGRACGSDVKSRDVEYEIAIHDVHTREDL